MADYLYYPGENLTIILLKNSGAYGEDVWPVAMGLSDLMFDRPYDLWKLRKAVMVPENTMKQYEGKYVLDKITVSFIVEGHHLVEKISEGLELKLHAESGNSFYPDNYNQTVHFIQDKSGRFTKAVIHEHGKDYVFKRTK